MKTWEYKLLATNIGLVYQFLFQLSINYLVDLERISHDVALNGFYDFFVTHNDGTHYIVITEIMGLYHIKYVTTIEWKFPVQQAMLIYHLIENK